MAITLTAMCYRHRTVAFLFLPALLASADGWGATITEVLPLTDRILMVHFDDGYVNHSKAGQS